MEIINPDKKIAVFDYDESSRTEELAFLTQGLDHLFVLPEVLNVENVPDASGARALSTVHLSDRLNLVNFLQLKTMPMGHWLFNSISQAASQFGLGKTRNIRQFKFHRTWANRIEQGCNTIAHRHAQKDWAAPHVVAILYVECAPGSADLVFVDDDSNVMRAEHISHYNAKLCTTIDSKAARLVVHDATYLHGTTEHALDQTRSCIIFEVGFPPLT
ncbi:putative 2OG-Fe(II) oxygenase [Pseudoalteromonas spongiae]|uniref:putative 2OG-Fe(II) oxygenase n=1 Tax=Pseudoalteromonas spongiae TaxID=298657 RepID=UPI00026CB3A7|nr:putative 2OG-Fe(II) oxygenase [Pseudoalteromonas spongiae]ATC98470.1 hypothetical protein PSPO_a1381 [Pseudoalteromonas spongiae UST010723-006]